MTYVISDLHGRHDLYQKMMKEISFGAEDLLYILGDIEDRNEGGIQIFKAIMDEPNIRMLLGNHEHMMLQAIRNPEKISLNGYETNQELWYRNGGEVTETEFWREQPGIQKKILSYLEKLPLNLNVNVKGMKYLLAHSIPVCMFKKYGREYDSVADFAVWERIESWMNVDFQADFLICGHTPTWYYRDTNPMEICRIRENVYDIDCGCASGEECGGRLACLRLEDMKAFYTGA